MQSVTISKKILYLLPFPGRIGDGPEGWVDGPEGWADGPEGWTDGPEGWTNERLGGRAGWEMKGWEA
jgi:hypothetical protein